MTLDSGTGLHTRRRTVSTTTSWHALQPQRTAVDDNGRFYDWARSSQAWACGTNRVAHTLGCQRREGRTLTYRFARHKTPIIFPPRRYQHGLNHRAGGGFPAAGFQRAVADTDSSAEARPRIDGRQPAGWCTSPAGSWGVPMALFVQRTAAAAPAMRRTGGARSRAESIVVRSARKSCWVRRRRTARKSPTPRTCGSNQVPRMSACWSGAAACQARRSVSKRPAPRLVQASRWPDRDRRTGPCRQSLACVDGARRR